MSGPGPRRGLPVPDGRILVTGATGFIGRHVTALIAPAAPVRALVRTPPPAGVLPPGCEIATGDLRDPGAVLEAVRDCRTVIHCAARVADWGSPGQFRETNVAGTAHVVDACRRHGVARLLHVSTTDVYGYPDRAVDEDAPLVPCGLPYPDTKIAAERLVWQAAAGGLPVSIVRPASVIGPGSASLVRDFLPLLDLGMIPDLARPEAQAGLTHVGSTADAICRIAASPDTIGRAFNLHDGFEVRWAGYLGDLARMTGRRARVVRLPAAGMAVAGWLCETATGLTGSRSRPAVSRMAVRLLGTEQSMRTDRFHALFVRTGLPDYRETMQEIVAWLAGTAPGPRPLEPGGSG